MEPEMVKRYVRIVKMPSHPERVRRNYHNVKIVKLFRPQNNDTEFLIHITRRDIASVMSKYEVERMIWNKIRNELTGTN